MLDIIRAIEESQWADRTKKNRIAFLKTLKANLAPTTNNYDFLKNFNIVSKFILDSTKNPATRKTKIITIKSILTLINDRSATKYDKLIHTLVNDADEYKGNNIVKDDNKWITYEEMLEIPYIIESDIKFVYNKLFLNEEDIDELKSKAAKHKYLRTLTEYIISILYCHQAPLRTEWSSVQFKPSKTNNWYDSHKGIIHINDFKNVKKMGPQSWPLSSGIKDQLNEYISILNYIIENPKKLLYLVGSKDYKEFTNESFSTAFSRIMKHYTKKDISINTMRHVYETHVLNSPNYHKLSIEDKKKVHMRLLHSAATAQDYIKLKDKISIKEFEDKH